MYFIEADDGSDDDEMNLANPGENEDSTQEKRFVCYGHHPFLQCFLFNI